MNLWEICIRLFLCALVPVAMSAVFCVLRKKTKFRTRLTYPVQQLIIGVAFGIAAIIGTEFGTDVGGAVANARDAAPLCAGLVFGGPAGIIAGVIGGVERWFAVYWGAGTFTRLACTLSTILAGIYAALLRKFMFDDKRPTWGVGFATGSVMEVIHLSMMFITNPDSMAEAFELIKLLAIPMCLVTGGAVMLSLVAVTLIIHHKKSGEIRIRKISQQVQAWLLLAVVLAFAVTTLSVLAIQTNASYQRYEQLMKLSLDDIGQDIMDVSDSNLLRIAKIAASEYENDPKSDLTAMTNQLGISEVNIIDEKGFIVSSTNPEYVGFDMRTGKQSEAFLVLLDGEKEFVQEYQNVAFAEYDDERAFKYAGIALSGGGFIQVGYNAEKFHSDIEETVKSRTAYRHVGSSGIVFVADQNRKVVSSHLKDNKIDIDGVAPGERFIYTHDKDKYICMYDTSEAYYIVAVVPETEVFESRDNVLYLNGFMEVLVFAALFIMIYILIKKLVVDKIRSVNNSLGSIISGDLDVMVNVHSSDEFSSLSDDINTTVSTLKNYIDEAAKRIDKELEFAKSIQNSALPSVFPAYPNIKSFDIYATMDTAKEVGGDFYDFYMIDDNHLAFLIADVSGKGIPAAMFMMTAKTMIKNLAVSGMEVDNVMTDANERLCEGNDAGMFVTAWLGIIDLRNGHVKFANAGHNPPLVCRNDSGFAYMRSRPGFVLAGMEGVHYKVQEFDLKPGERICLYTDGVTEATNLQSELYGEDRLLTYLNNHCVDAPEKLLRGIRTDVRNFVGEAEQFDDITMLILDYKGSENGKTE